MKMNTLMVATLLVLLAGCDSSENPLLGDWVISLPEGERTAVLTFADNFVSFSIPGTDEFEENNVVEYFVSYGSNEEVFYSLTLAGESQMGLVNIVNGQTLQVWSNGGIEVTATRREP